MSTTEQINGGPKAEVVKSSTSINQEEALAVIAHRQAIAKSDGAEIPMLMCANCGAMLKDRSGAHVDGSPMNDCCPTAAVLVDARSVVYNKEYKDADGKVVPAGTEIHGAVQVLDKAEEIARLEAQLAALNAKP